jgi:hypothetical protein
MHFSFFYVGMICHSQAFCRFITRGALRSYKATDLPLFIKPLPAVSGLVPQPYTTVYESFKEKTRGELGEMVRLINCLLHKCGGLSSDAQYI